MEGYGHNNDNNFLQQHHHHHNSVVEAKKCFKYAKDTKIKHLVSHVKGFLLLFFYFIYLFLLNIAAVKRFSETATAALWWRIFFFVYINFSKPAPSLCWIIDTKKFSPRNVSSCCYCCFFSRGAAKCEAIFFSSFCDSFTMTTTMVVVVCDAEELDRFCCWANCVSSMCVLMLLLLLLLLCTASFFSSVFNDGVFYCRVICMMRFRCLHIKWMEMMNFLSFFDEGLLGMFCDFFFV